MTQKEYEETMNNVKTMEEHFRWELIKALWQIAKALETYSE